MLSARETFHAGQLTIVAGELVQDDDPVVAGNEHLFGEGVQCPTCQASANAAEDALEALRLEAEAAAKANADLQAALEAVTAERDAAVAAAAEAAKTTPAKAKG